MGGGGCPAAVHLTPILLLGVPARRNAALAVPLAAGVIVAWYGFVTRALGGLHRVYDFAGLDSCRAPERVATHVVPGIAAAWALVAWLAA